MDKLAILDNDGVWYYAVVTNGKPEFLIENGTRVPIDTLATAAAALGRRGGKSTSPAKRAAARRNGRKGGRPRKKK